HRKGLLFHPHLTIHRPTALTFFSVALTCAWRLLLQGNRLLAHHRRLRLHRRPEHWRMRGRLAAVVVDAVGVAPGVENAQSVNESALAEL
ncbi:hypothetical protein, partial [Cupriavidus sp. CuC1]|uniref:hypothetical protein n=1 Tax=Cupriavidus sp. CuC1 TaxID=3373131 RepID=UPI0037CD2F3A